jgi:hypothetical protein
MIIRKSFFKIFNFSFKRIFNFYITHTLTKIKILFIIKRFFIFSTFRYILFFIRIIVTISIVFWNILIIFIIFIFYFINFSLSYFIYFFFIFFFESILVFLNHISFLKLIIFFFFYLLIFSFLIINPSPYHSFILKGL